MDSHLIDMNGRLGFKKRFPYNYKGGHIVTALQKSYVLDEYHKTI